VSPETPQGDLTILLQRMRDGDNGAADRLIPMVLSELRQLAQHYLRSERAGHTLQPTALVNEAYLRLMGDQARTWQNRAHFVGVTASMMRRILIDQARRHRTAKRGGGEAIIEIDSKRDGLAFEQPEDILALNDALDRLEKFSPRQRQVVELRYFGGLTLEETAEAMNVSIVTVRRDWLAARAWLKGQIRPESVVVDS
jgi:RNA polymerase sigma-70 factor, ECF subfamily